MASASDDAGVDMDLIAWVVALGLLGVGLYRLWRDASDSRDARKPSAPAGQLKREDPAYELKPLETKSLSAEASSSEAGSAARPLPTTARSVDHLEDEDDITVVTLAPAALSAARTLAVEMELSRPQPPVAASAASAASSSAILTTAANLVPMEDDDDDEEGRPSPVPSAVPIVYDDDAGIDEPTRNAPWILVSAASQTDRGRRRRRNEDSVLVLPEEHLFVVADGMGGHAGGDVASKMAVEVIGQAFKTSEFGGDPYPDVPPRGSELALAIQLANKAIHDHARNNLAYKGMGTTVVSARFSPHKQRVYFGHVGDSRAYRLRGGKLTQVTTDHTMGAEGIDGPLANHLNRAVGIHTGVKVDLIIARPLPDDVYVLCSDGLSKMVSDEVIRDVLTAELDAQKAVGALVAKANENGGRDNITVVVVQVRDAQGVARMLRANA